MPILVLESTSPVSGVGSDSGLARVERECTTAFAGTGLLRRNAVVAAVPDPHYWTAYDHYMIEREARTMRAAQINALLGKGWQALSRLVSG